MCEQELTMARNYIEEHRISPLMKMQVLSYIRRNRSHARASSEEQEQVLAMLSLCLRRDLLWEARANVLSNSILCSAWRQLHPISFERLCISILRTRDCPAEETIFSVAEQAQSVKFVEAGVFRYWRCKKYAIHRNRLSFQLTRKCSDATIPEKGHQNLRVEPKKNRFGSRVLVSVVSSRRVNLGYWWPIS